MASVFPGWIPWEMVKTGLAVSAALTVTTPGEAAAPLSWAPTNPPYVNPPGRTSVSTRGTPLLPVPRLLITIE